MDLRVNLFGRFEAGGHEFPVGIRGHLLAYLAYGGDWISRERIAYLFWPDTVDASARRNLRQVLNRFKSLQLPLELEADSQRLRWCVPTDVADLRNAVGRQDWELVLRLYRGELLSQYDVDTATGFGSWLEAERSNLQSVRQRAALALAASYSVAKAFDEAAGALAPLLEVREPDEDITVAYMRSAYLAGQREAALHAYRQLELALESEYGAEPLDITRQLAATIRAAEPLYPSQAGEMKPTVPITLQRPPRLVARESTVREVMSASTPLVLIRGEAGVGKSRLLDELAPRAPRVRCLENLQPLPFQPLRSLLEELHGRYGVPDGYSVQAIELARLFPQFAPGTDVSGGDPETARSRLLAAIAHYLELVLPAGDGASFQLVADDLQWADSATLELLTVLAQQGRVRVLGALRRFEESSDLAALTTSLKEARLASIVELWPLDSGATGLLLTDLIGNQENSPAFSRWLFESSGGNIMFALETLKALFEAGSLRSSESGWESDLDRITTNYREFEQPRAVTDVIGRRTARLSEPAQRTVQAASVVGEGFDAGLLSLITDLGQWEMLDVLEELSAAGLIENSRFRHDLIRQAIYGSLTSDRLKLLHARTAAAIDADAQPLVAALHFQLSGNLTAATDNWLAGAAGIRDQGLYDDALKLLEGAADKAAEAGDSRAAWRLKAEVAGTLRGLARFREAEQAALEVLQGCPDPQLRAIALDALAGSLLHLGKLEEAEAAAHKGLQLALKAGDERLHLSINTLLASILFYRGKQAEAAVVVEDAVVRLRQAGSELDLAVQLSNLGAILDELGRSDEALGLHSEALDIAERLSARRQLVDIVLNLLICHTCLGTVDEYVLTLAETTLQAGNFDGTDTLRNNYAYALLQAGRTKEAAAQWQLLADGSSDPTLKLIAWSRLSRLHKAAGAAGLVEAALNQVRSLSALTELPVGLAAAAIALFECGNTDDRELAFKVAGLSGYQPDSVPEFLAELSQVFEAQA